LSSAGGNGFVENIEEVDQTRIANETKMGKADQIPERGIQFDAKALREKYRQERDKRCVSWQRAIY
jgi:hypothetical protein